MIKKETKSIMRRLSFALVFLLTVTLLPVASHAGSSAGPSDPANREQMLKCVISKGYLRDTAEALSEDDLRELYQSIKKGESVSIKNCSMEVDNLAEIEALLLRERDGTAGKQEQQCAAEVRQVLKCSDDYLKEQYGFSDAEIKALRSVAENIGQKDRFRGVALSGDVYGNTSNNGRAGTVTADVKNTVPDSGDDAVEDDVEAAGSISGSKLSFTQAVTNKSKKKSCQYNVKVSYKWKKAYSITSFSDYIAVGWGGQMSSKKEKGSSSYYRYFGSKWRNKKYPYNPVKMRKTAQPNKGCYFEQKQMRSNKNSTPFKAKKGSVSLTVFQSGKPKKATKIVSQYLHRTWRLSSTIGIAGSGPSVNIAAKKGYDKSAQLDTNVKYPV